MIKDSVADSDSLLVTTELFEGHAYGSLRMSKDLRCVTRDEQGKQRVQSAIRDSVTEASERFLQFDREFRVK